MKIHSIYKLFFIISLVFLSFYTLYAEKSKTLLPNFHEIEPNLAYRSAQPTSRGLCYMIEMYGIKTIVNLRGSSQQSDWYCMEKGICENENVTLIDIPLSAHKLPDKKTLLTLFDTFLEADYPILIHCRAGADRTGAVAALWRMTVLGESHKEASKQLSTKFLHFKSQTPKMDLLVEIFQPDRQWILNEYDPTLYSPRSLSYLLY